MDKLISNPPSKILIFTLLLSLSSVFTLKISKLTHESSHLVTYKDNLQAKNWYYGNLSSVTYRLRLFKAATVQPLQPCSLSLPFTSLDMKQCQNCPPEKPLRNLEAQLCQPCPNLEKYDPKTGNCTKLNIDQIPTEKSVIANNLEVISGKQTSIIPIVVNPISTQPLAPVVNIQPLSITNKQAPQGTGQTQGQSSKIEKQDSEKSLTGTSSKENAVNTLINNTEVKKTSEIINQTLSNLNSSTGANKISENKTTSIINSTNQKTNVTAVSKQTDFSSTGVSSSTNRTNQSINTNSIQTQTNKTIQQKASINTTSENKESSSTSANSMNKTNTIQSISPQKINNNSKQQNSDNQNTKVQTPISTKPITGEITYTCKGIYNSSNKQCLPCPTQTQYIQLSNSCLPIIYVANLEKAIDKLIQPKKNYVQEQIDHIKSQHPTRNIKTCIENKPFLSVSSGFGICTSCPDNQYFIVLTQKCTEGCQLGTIFNSVDKTCQPGRFYTNPESSNLLSPSQVKYEAWKERISKEKNEISGNKFCPNEAPFEVNNQCINCNSAFPYFNFDIQKCVDCGTGRGYDQKQRKCKAYFDGGISIERMIANIL